MPLLSFARRGVVESRGAAPGWPALFGVRRNLDGSFFDRPECLSLPVVLLAPRSIPDEATRSRRKRYERV